MILRAGFLETIVDQKNQINHSSDIYDLTAEEIAIVEGK
jgi:hypothetical protein